MLSNYWYIAGLFAGITLKFSVSTMDEDFPPDMCQIFTSEATLPLPNNGHHKRAIKEGFLRSNDPIRSRPQTQAGHVCSSQSRHVYYSIWLFLSKPVFGH